MSKQVDERVVSMQFDNKNFERNVSTSMSTLDKLKQKLNLTGASKGLENVSAAANKVDMGGLANGVQAVSTKFSALQVMAVTALANITNSVVNSAKRWVSALTVEPVGDGFKEYEMTLNAVQTTMAATSKTAEEVETQLKTLDEYADKTVYSTADMLNNLPKFTNAGVALEKATTAMIGIANATALAGGDASKASIAFYNLGQAIGTGYLTRMDYNSINNAGIATMEWKKQMVEAAIAQGTLTKVGEDAYKAGKKTFTLQQLFIDGLQEQWATTDVMMKVFGDYGDETTEIGKKSYAAAQDIKTFSQMMESLKATAGTGWKDTWQTIFGGLEEAKSFWTGLSDFLSKIITKIANFRNTVLENALGPSRLSKLSKTVNGMSKSVKNITKTTEEYAQLVKKIINGDYGNGLERQEKLTKAGYDYAHAQNLVNEKLGSSVRHVSKFTEALKENGSTQSHTIEQLAEMSDARLKDLGYTEDEIKALRELSKAAEEAAVPLGKFIEQIENSADGRTLLIDSFKNISEFLGKFFEIIKQAFKDTFGENMGDNISDFIYNAIKGFHDFTESLTITEQEAENFKTVFEGLLAAIQLSNWVIKGGLIFALKLAGAVLDLFGTNLVELGTTIADYIIQLRDWVDGNTIFVNSIGKIANIIKAVIDGVTRVTKALWKLEPIQKVIKKITTTIGGLFKNINVTGEGFDKFVNIIEGAFDVVVKWIETLNNSKGFNDFCNGIMNAIDSVAKWIDSLKDSEHLGKDIIDGLVNGVWAGIKGVVKTITSLGAYIIEAICKVLGIHSPSVVFYTIGGFIVAGLLLGLKDGVPEVTNTLNDIGASLLQIVSNIFTKIIEFVKTLDLGTVIAGVFGGAALFTINKIVKVMDKFANPLDKLGSLFSSGASALDTLGEALKANVWERRSNAIFTFAKAIALLVVAIVVLTKLDPDQMWEAVLAIGALAAIMLILAAATSAMNKVKGVGGKAISSILALSVAMLILAFTLKQLSGINPDNLGGSLIAFGALIVGLSVIMLAFGTFTKGNRSKTMKAAAKMLRSISITLLLMVAVIKLASMLKPEELVQGLITIGIFGVFLLTFVKVVKRSGEHAAKMGSMLLKVSLALILLVGVIKLIGLLSGGEIAKGIAVIAAIGTLFGYLIWITKFGGENANKAGLMLLEISVALAIIVFAIGQIAKMDKASIIKGLTVITALELLFAGLMFMSKYSGQFADKAGSMLLKMSIALAILAGVMLVLSFIEPKGLWNAVGAITVLMVVFAGLMYVSKYVGETDKIAKTLTGLSVAIAILAISIIALSFLDPKQAAIAAGAMTAVIGVFALLIYVTKFINTNKKAWQRSLGTLAVLTLIVAALAGVIYLLATIAPNGALEAAAGLSILLLAMSASLLIISNVGKLAKNALIGIGMLTLMAVPLLAFVGVLALAQNIQNATTNAMLLTGMMAAMTLLLIPLLLVGALIYPALLGIAALTLMAVPMLAFVGVLALMQNIQGATDNVMLLINLMSAMAAILVMIAPLAPLAVIGVAALTMLSGLMVTMGILAVAIGALMEKFPQLQTFLDSGLPVLIQIAGALGEMVGAFVGGMLAQISAALPEIATNLSQFMTNLQDFIDGARNVDWDVVKGVGILTAAILAMTSVELISAITSFASGLLGGSGLAGLGTELSQFMTNIMPFIAGATMLRPEMLSGVKALAETILILTAADVLNGLTSWITGGSSLADFGAQLGDLGTNMNAFATNLGTFDESKVTSVSCAAKAIKTLAEAAQSIPAGDGFWQGIVGETSLATFGSWLPQLGTDMASFATNLGTFDESKVTTVSCVSKAIISLAEAAEKIPAGGGIWQGIVGETSLATFSSWLPALGSNMSSFVTNLGTFEDDQVKTVGCVADAIVKLATAAQSIPAGDGFWQRIVGEQSLAAFGDKLPGLGEDIAGFADKAGSVDVEKVNKATQTLTSIVELAKIDTKDAGNNIGKFGDNLNSFGEKMASFTSKISEVGMHSITIAITKIKTLLQLAETAADTNVESLKTFGESLKSFAQDGVEGFVKAFANAEPKKQVTQAAKDLVDSVIKGVESKQSDVNDAFEKIANKANDKVGTWSQYNGFKKAGSYLVEGFAKGITDKTWHAEAKAKAMAEAAVEAARKALKINSPSKVFRAIGSGIPEGFAMGIGMFGSAVEDATTDMAKGAIDETRKSMSRIADVINGDIDSQPTIRPVLDLSDVESGANTINNLFARRTLAVNTNAVGAISASMAKIQNGDNSGELLSTMKGLRKDIADMPRNSYNINGITYDDGSNITNAVQSLVRAAKIERRT